jgi:hypothetical protein
MEPGNGPGGPWEVFTTNYRNLWGVVAGAVAVWCGGTALAYQATDAGRLGALACFSGGLALQGVLALRWLVPAYGLEVTADAAGVEFARRGRRDAFP